MRKYLLALAIISVTVACGPRRGQKVQQPSSRAFPRVEAPVMMETAEERLEYIVLHFWDAFAKVDQPTDSLTIGGVKKADVESQMGVFATLLQQVPIPMGQKAVRALYANLEKAPGMFDPMVELTSRYLWDPNSPVRNEALYLPFVQALSSSPLVKDDLKPGYAWDARLCALNLPGTTAADFRFVDTSGRTRTLHSVKAEYVLLVFGNPDCTACRELVEDMSSIPEISALEASGRLKVIDIYIDQEIDVWKQRMASYPKNWINGYDPDYVIRQDHLYDVRAVPSIYLLDKDKTVLLKDAPENVALDALTQL